MFKLPYALRVRTRKSYSAESCKPSVLPPSMSISLLTIFPCVSGALQQLLLRWYHAAVGAGVETGGTYQGCPPLRSSRDYRTGVHLLSYRRYTSSYQLLLSNDIETTFLSYRL